MTRPTRAARRALGAVLAIAGVLVAFDCAAAVPVLGYRVVRAYPHDASAFTQGLLFHDGHLYESTGGWGHSSVRIVDLDTGTVRAERRLEQRYFGEGLARVGGSLFQLTWRSHRGFVWDADTLAPRGTFSYPTEGWGLTYDGSHLLLSDGSAFLYRVDPATFGLLGRVEVRADGVPVERLNELEFVHGYVLANVWQTDRLARIDPVTGEVVAWIDLTGLLDAHERAGAGVLNGIAWDAARGRLFVTGKNWPRLYQIEIVE